MPLALAHQTRIVPLSLSTWNRINPTGTPLIFDLMVYSSPMSMNECSCDGRILYIHAMYEEIGPGYADVYTHSFLREKDFLLKFGPPGPHEMSRVRVTGDATTLTFQVMPPSVEIVMLELNMPYAPEDAPIVHWARTIRDQAFVDRILDLGKGFVLYGDPEFRFEMVIELAPGVVFTIESGNRNPVVYVDDKRYLNLKEDKLSGLELEIANDLMIFRSSKFPVFPHDQNIEALREQILDLFKVMIVDPKHHKDPATYMWQRRSDLLPQNW